MVKVKICGLTDEREAVFCAQAGADYVGVVVYPKSPRFVPPERRRGILKALKDLPVKTVAVTVNESPEALLALLEEGFDLLQLHGDEEPSVLRKLPPERVIKAFRVKEALPEVKGWEGVHAFLFDAYDEKAYGGSGKRFRWELVKDFKGRFFLAGGLTPENVGKAVKLVRPYAVDVSSGVERSKGRKDLKKVELFIKRAKGAL
ncbi:MAG: phosphoribosylanthranilate isomerase [Aquificae bacterium]|nr:phosphoribosylanthranilate isomerase [Aquificota bacterium]